MNDSTYSAYANCLKCLSSMKLANELLCPVFVCLQYQHMNGQEIKSITSTYQNWEDPTEEFQNHTALEHHQDSIEKLNSFGNHVAATDHVLYKTLQFWSIQIENIFYQ